MSFSMQGRVAVVTGNSSGLGRAIGIALGRAGAKVPVNYLNNTERAERALAAYEETGIPSRVIRVDVATEDGVGHLFAETEKHLGPVDIVVVNATPDQSLRPIEDYDWAVYQSMLDFFVKSPYLLARQALPHMKSQRWGRFINITSEVYHLSVAPFSAYVSAKGGQIGWSRSMARELAPHNITVNTIAPGWIPVERHEQDPIEMKEAYLQQIPMKRWGTPEDVAHAAVFFASEAASFVTGQTLCVNGGNSPW